MLEAEQPIQQALNQAGILATAETPTQFDTDGAPIRLGATKLTSMGRSLKEQRPDKRLEVREIMKMPQVVFLKMAYADRPGASSGLSTTYGILFFVGFLALCRTVVKDVPLLAA